jgi:primase-polymerase (primpol)-like protein
VGDGLGFVLNGDGIACVDLDHCIDGGVLAPWAQLILDRTPATYVEVSPSGTGLHIFGFAHVGLGRNKGGVEFYDRGRYMTVTGKRWGKAPRALADISGLIASL